MDKLARNKFLTEAMDLCWHDFSNDKNLSCPLCHVKYTKLEPRIDFSTWEGFGKLWEYCITQSWFDHFMWKVDPFRKYYSAISGPPAKTWNIDPDNFANDLYKYLKEIEE